MQRLRSIKLSWCIASLIFFSTDFIANKLLRLPICDHSGYLHARLSAPDTRLMVLGVRVPALYLTPGSHRSCLVWAACGLQTGHQDRNLVYCHQHLDQTLLNIVRTRHCHQSPHYYTDIMPPRTKICIFPSFRTFVCSMSACNFYLLHV